MAQITLGPSLTKMVGVSVSELYENIVTTVMMFNCPLLLQSST